MSNYNKFYLYKVKKVGKLHFYVTENSGRVKNCYRKVGVTNLNDDEFCLVDLWDDKALLELKVGQVVMADLEFKYMKDEKYGELIDEIRAKKFIPLKNNIKIHFVEDDELD